MNYTKTLLSVLSILISIHLMGQNEDNKVKVKFSGFIKSDIYHDSREVVAARDGQFLLYPKNELFDDMGNDINKVSNFNMLSIQTRLKTVVTGPEVLGAMPTGVIEAAFLGNKNTDINSLRLRHAYINLNWTNSSLLVGQTWHTFMITECYPGTVSFNTGAPFMSALRNPQIKYTHRFGSISLVAAAMSQLDFTDAGPNPNNGEPESSSVFLRRAGIPELSIGVQYKKEFGASNAFHAGAFLSYKQLLPRQSITRNNTTIKLTEKVKATSFMVYAKAFTKPVTVKTQLTYGQALQSNLMLGGYGERVIFDPNNHSRPIGIQYAPTNTLSYWLDAHTNGKTIQAGLFAGYTENCGSDKELDTYYMRGYDIKYVYRVSPRVIYNVNKFRLSFEMEYTAAGYNNDVIDKRDRINTTKEVGNIRFLGGVYYFF
ncbi:MAG: hypothetical protein ACEPOV_13545 [Hyphomicrobiales bacterium]